jgi:hypothetical protein
MIDLTAESWTRAAWNPKFQHNMPDRPARRLTEPSGALANFH